MHIADMKRAFERRFGLLAIATGQDVVEIAHRSSDDSDTSCLVPVDHDTDSIQAERSDVIESETDHEIITLSCPKTIPAEPRSASGGLFDLLPFEVRLRIYELAFEAEKINIPLNPRKSSRRVYPCGYRHPLTRLNKEFYLECARLFYDNIVYVCEAKLKEVPQAMHMHTLDTTCPEHDTWFTNAESRTMRQVGMMATHNPPEHFEYPPLVYWSMTDVEATFARFGSTEQFKRMVRKTEGKVEYSIPLETWETGVLFIMPDGARNLVNTRAPTVLNLSSFRPKQAWQYFPSGPKKATIYFYVNGAGTTPMEAYNQPLQ